MSNPPPLLPWLTTALARGLGLRAHALMLHGPGNVGQFELGVALASGWLCESDNEALRPCGKCSGCCLMAAHMHPDFHLLVPDALREPLGWNAAADGDDGGKNAETGKTKAKPSKEIRVEAVRAAIEWGQKTSSRGRAKVILIHPAQAMNQIAANALLKTLEEPAGRLRLLLTAHDPEALLPTVRSRCQRLRLDLPAAAQAREWLAAQGVAQAQALLAAAGGQPQEVLELLAEGIDGSAWERVPAALRRGDASALAGWPLPRLIDTLSKLCHDLMCMRADTPPRYFSANVLAPLLEPAMPDWPALARWSRELTLAGRHADHPWHSGLRCEALVGQGAQLWQTPRKPERAAGGALDTLDPR